MTFLAHTPFKSIVERVSYFYYFVFIYFNLEVRTGSDTVYR